MATTLTQKEFEQQIGVDTVRRGFDDDGDGEADTHLVMNALERADAMAVGILSKGNDAVWARKILQGDISARGYAYDIAAGMMGMRRPEFMNAVGGNGGSLYQPAANVARKELERMSDAETRSRAEREAGANAHVAAGVTHRPTDQFVFLTSRNRRGGRDTGPY